MYREPPRGSKKKTYLELHHPRWEWHFASSLIWVELFCDPLAVILWPFCSSFVILLCSQFHVLCLHGRCPHWPWAGLPRCPALSISHTLLYKNAAPGSPWTRLLARGGPAFMCAMFTTFMRITGFHFSVQSYTPQGWNCLTCTQNSTQQRAA